ncbi:MAG: alpha/beta fold hydrolase [Steroidobacteraceae bacterium]
MKKCVLFIHGAGTRAYAEDRLLADALQQALGGNYDVQCPQMPDEENAPYPAWKAEIDSRLAAMKSPVALVGHSVGGSVLLKYLCEQRTPPQIAGLFVIAAPYWGASEFWSWDEGALPADAAARLAGDWPLIFYQSRDDEVVPFAHLALYAAKLPRAAIREFDGRGHQFKNDLTEIAADIKS